MALFYLPNIEGDQIELPQEESRHVVRVLRMQVGDPLELTDGKGLFCRARIRQLAKQSVALDLIEKQVVAKPRKAHLHMAVAPVKNLDRLEWFLEKATEIGVDEITPVITQNSERRNLRPERLEKILVSAMKQSLKVYKPILNPLMKLDEFVNRKHIENQKFIAWCGEGDKLLLKQAYEKGKNAVILIGPEGDFTEEEVDKAIACNYQVVSLGESRLRTETAAVVACHSFEILNQ